MTVILDPLALTSVPLDPVVYTVTGPDGTRAVFNDTSDPDWVGFTNGEDGVTGLERAAVRESAEDLPEADGGVHGTFLYGRLAFTLQGIIPPDPHDTWMDRQERLLRATDAMRADAILAWTPPIAGADRREVSFRQQQPTRVTGRRPRNFLITGVCEDPTVRGATPRSVTIDLAGTESGGLASPLTSPFSSGADIIGQVTITNLGRSTAWPLITIEGPAINPSIRNESLGRTLAFSFALDAGEFLVVETSPRRRRVLLNGTTNQYLALDWQASTWWGLRPGPNDIRLDIDGYDVAITVVTLEYRDTWG